MTLENIGEPEDSRPYIDTHGKRVYEGDPVVIARIYKDPDPEKGQAADCFENPFNLPAIFMGVDTVECDGEVLLDGETVPILSVILPDGSSDTILGIECDWSHPDIYAEAMNYVADVNNSPLN